MCHILGFDDGEDADPSVGPAFHAMVVESDGGRTGMGYWTVPTPLRHLISCPPFTSPEDDDIRHVLLYGLPEWGEFVYLVPPGCHSRLALENQARAWNKAQGW